MTRKGDLAKDSIVHIALCDPMISIFKQCSSLGPDANQINPHFQMNMCQVLSGGRQDKYRFLRVLFLSFHLFTYEYK